MKYLCGAILCAIFASLAEGCLKQCETIACSCQCPGQKGRDSAFAMTSDTFCRWKWQQGKIGEDEVVKFCEASACKNSTLCDDHDHKPSPIYDENAMKQQMQQLIDSVATNTDGTTTVKQADETTDEATTTITATTVVETTAGTTPKAKKAKETVVKASKPGKKLKKDKKKGKSMKLGVSVNVVSKASGKSGEAGKETSPPIKKLRKTGKPSGKKAPKTTTAQPVASEE